MNINLGFVTPFININSDIDVSFLETYVEDIKQTVTPKNRSNYGGSQYGLNQTNPQLIKLNVLILETMKTVLDLYKVSDEYKPTVDEMWLNINPLGGFNRPHIHPQPSFFSGCFYVKVPKDSGNIVFMNTTNALDYHICDMYKEYNRYNSARYTYVPKSGSLILFPSWITHFVEPNLSNEERVSIPFNIKLDKTEKPNE